MKSLTWRTLQRNGLIHIRIRDGVIKLPTEMAAIRMDARFMVRQAILPCEPATAEPAKMHGYRD